MERLTVPLKLTDYSPGWVDAKGSPRLVHVWVNPPLDFWKQYQSLATRLQGLVKISKTPGVSEGVQQRLHELHIEGVRDIAGWWAALWSQHPDPATHWTVDEVLSLCDDFAGDDAFVKWLTSRSLKLVTEYLKSAHWKEHTTSWPRMSWNSS